jgi:UPF0755 protein
LRRWIGLALLAAAVATAAWLLALDRYAMFGSPEVFVDIPRGTSSWSIGRSLADAGVIRTPLLFLAARVLHPRSKPLAGEYLFTRPATPLEVFGRIARGDIYRIDVTVPEGANVFEIAALLRHAGLRSAGDFAERALPDEGFLFPSTYSFRRSAMPEDIIAAMRRRFDHAWSELHTTAPQRETVILASLIEKEAVLDSERPRIAAVYLNRLGIGMKLDCDPTVAYAAMLEHRWRGTIFKADLEDPHPYNTYVNAGLPPGPVANPGLASLKAALHPAHTKDLYFVAVPHGSGAHVFSETLDGHQRAVAAYRRAEQKTANSRVARRPGARRR